MSSLEGGVSRVFQLFLPFALTRSLVLLPILQMKSLRHREVKKLAQGHTVAGPVPQPGHGASEVVCELPCCTAFSG